MNILEVKNLCYSRDRSLFSNLSFCINASELLLVNGPNGSGKTSLLRLLTGLVTPSSGEIYWQNKGVYECQKKYWQVLHYVGHNNAIKLGLTVNENIERTNYLSSPHYSGSITRFRHSSGRFAFKSEVILSQFQLIDYKNTQAKFLSAGQRRRLSLMKLFLHPKPIWILDEPTTALDQSSTALFVDYLKMHLLNGGIAIISSHHDISIKEVGTKYLRLGL